MSAVITPGNLGPEFDFGTIQGGKVRLKLGAGLAIQPDGTIVALASTPERMFEVNGDNGAVINGDATDFTVTRTAAGRYSITSTTFGPFGLVVTARTSDGNTTDRDNKKIQYRAIANGYEITTTVDDNGGAPDGYENEHFIAFIRSW